jgi:hypothetical protein
MAGVRVQAPCLVFLRTDPDAGTGTSRMDEVRLGTRLQGGRGLNEKKEGEVGGEK